jgi:hypothetical protein
MQRGTLLLLERLWPDLPSRFEACLSQMASICSSSSEDCELFTNSTMCPTNQCCSPDPDEIKCRISLFMGWIDYLLISLESSTPCLESTLDQCPEELCIRNSTSCIDRLKTCHISLSVQLTIRTAFLSEECECTEDGISGNVSTGIIGCTRHDAFNSKALTRPEAFCFVKGGAAADCPCAKKSSVFPGAAYRVCISCRLRCPFFRLTSCFQRPRTTWCLGSLAIW